MVHGSRFSMIIKYMCLYMFASLIPTKPVMCKCRKENCRVCSWWNREVVGAFEANLWLCYFGFELSLPHFVHTKQTQTPRGRAQFREMRGTLKKACRFVTTRRKNKHDQKYDNMRNQWNREGDRAVTTKNRNNFCWLSDHYCRISHNSHTCMPFHA